MNRCRELSRLVPAAVQESSRSEDNHARRARHGRWGPRFVGPLACLAAAAWGVAPPAARADSGFYLSSEIGMNIAPSLDTLGTSNDRASVCDEFINPMYATVTQTAGYESYNCTGPDRGATGDWENTFDGASGILAGVAAGYSLREAYPDSFLGRLRLEVEYVYRNTGYDQTADVPSAAGESGDKLVQEIRRATDRIDSIDSHNVFGNLYLDFETEGRFTPYLGFGAGVGITDMGHASVWARNPDPAAIVTGEGLPNADEIRRNLAATTSVAQGALSDTLFGYQVLVGVDYALSETLSLGVKGRWVNFGSFSGGPVVWDPLRSHQPNLRRDGSEPVSGRFNIDDIKIFGVSMTLKYHL